MVGATGKCAKDQTFSCAADWRLLVPLWRTDVTYHELKQSHQSYEAVHDYWRDRYKVAADNLANRPKVRSIGWHRLRANVAALVDWLRICSRQGWLGSARRNHAEPTRKFKLSGRRAAGQLAGMRLRAGIAALRREAPQAQARRPRPAVAAERGRPVAGRHRRSFLIRRATVPIPARQEAPRRP